LAERWKLYALIVPQGVWLPVNTLKELDEAKAPLRNY